MLTTLFFLCGVGLAPQLEADGHVDRQPPPSAPNIGRYIENVGQWPDEVEYSAEIGGIELWFTRDSVWLQAVTAPSKEPEFSQSTFSPRVEDHTRTGRRHVLRLQFPGADFAQIRGMELEPGRWNYLRGPRADWRTGARGFGRLDIVDAWPGIDLQFKQDSQGRPRFDVLLDPGVAASSFSMRVQGAGTPELRSGRLELGQDGASWVLTSPKSFLLGPSEAAGATRLDSAWQLRTDGTLGFGIQNTPGTGPILIDPSILFSSYLGGLGDDEVTDVHLDASSVMTVVGVTRTAAFPTTPGVFDESFDTSKSDVFVARIAAGGTVPLYSTYVDGPGQSTFDKSAFVDVAGEEAVVVCSTSGIANVTPGAFFSTHADPLTTASVAVLRLNSAGTDLVYSARVGGPGLNFPFGIELSEDESVLFFGSYSGGPTGFWPSESTFENEGLATIEYGSGFVALLSPDGSDLVHSLSIGGSGRETIVSARLLDDGSVIFGGETSALDFPTTPEAMQPTPVPPVTQIDGFYARTTPDWNELRVSSLVSSSRWDSVHEVLPVGQTAYWVLARIDELDVAWPPGADVELSLPGGTQVAFLLFDAETDELIKVRWAYDHVIEDAGLDIDGGLLVFGRAAPDLQFPFLTPGLAFGPPGRTTISKYDPLGEGWVYSHAFGGSQQNPLLIETNVGSAHVAGPDLVAIGGRSNVTNMVTTPGAVDTVHGPYQQDEGWFGLFDLTPDGYERFGVPSSACNGETRIGLRRLPTAGEAEFGLSCVGAPPSAPGILARSIQPLAVPLQLDGISVWLDLASVFVTPVVADNLGWAGVELPLTLVPAGVSAYFQFAWVDPGSCGAIGGLSASDAIGLTVQP